MTRTPDPATVPIPIQEQEGPVDPRPAWERVAYAWLAREVDHGQPVDPPELAAELSVAPGFAGDLVRVLRATASATRSSRSCAAGWCATGSPTPT
jgi:hypothetical protein